MARYTDKLVATLRQRYEHTDQPMYSIAAEFDIGTRTLQRLVNSEGWSKRSERPRGLPVAVRLLEEARALGAKHNASDTADGGVGWAKRSAPANASPQSDASPDEGCVGTAPAAPLPTLQAEPSAIDRLEALVVEQIEAARTQVTGKRRAATASDRIAHRLATLTQALRTLHGMRAGNFPHSDFSEQETLPDDDMPSDIDEFRRDLARRIDAFVASRTDAADAGSDSERAPVDEAG